MNNCADKNMYEIIGINRDKVRVYKCGTIKQIEENELLDNEGTVTHNSIEEIIKDMDIFSDYKHYYKVVNHVEENDSCI